MAFWSRRETTPDWRPEAAVRLFADPAQPDRVRRAQLEAVAGLADRFAGDPDPARPAAAAESFDLLVAALADRLPWVRSTALDGLSALAGAVRHRLGPGRLHAALGPVTGCLGDPEQTVRAAACAALPSLVDGADVPAATWVVRTVGAALHDPSPAVRGAALTSLGRLAVPAAWEYLPAADAALADPDARVRTGALEAFGALHRAAGLPPPAHLPPRVLWLLVHDPDAWVRSAAARALQPLAPDPAAAVPALVTALRDPEELVRHDAVFALGDHGAAADPAVPALAALAGGEHRVSVGFALRAVGTPAARQALHHAGLPLTDPVG